MNHSEASLPQKVNDLVDSKKISKIDSSTTSLQLMFILIIVSAGLMLGRILAVDNIPDRSIQDYRIRLIPKQLSDKKKELENQKVQPERINLILKKTAATLLQDAQKERPTLSANDRSRWLTIRALVEPESRVYRYYPVQKDSDSNNIKPIPVEKLLRNCSCECSQQFNKENKKAGKYVKSCVPYAIDKAMETPGWDSIDIVKHGLPNEEYDPANPLSGYLYSSKPTLLPTVMAVPYWLLFHSTGISLKENPFLAVRILLICINLIPLIIAWFLLAKTINRIGFSDWSNFFAMSVVCFATFVSTFVVTLNNHIPGVVSIIIATYAGFQILYEKRIQKRYFVLAGLFGAFAVACELPVLAMTALFCFILLAKYPSKTILVAIPCGLIVVVGFFGTNYRAHGTFKPAYAQKRDHVSLAQQQSISKDDSILEESLSQETLNSKKQLNDLESDQSHISEASKSNRESGKSEPNLLTQQSKADSASPFLVQTFDPDDWYVYHYIPSGKSRDVKNSRLSHWANRTGIDRGEPSQKTYAFHATVGHHGLFSLTPVWILSILSLLMTVFRRKISIQARCFAILILGLSLLFFVFYLTRDQGDRNYGGMTCGLRWFFPLIPFWVLIMLPLLDKISKFRIFRGIALILLFFSAMSVAYPVWNPWSHPWLYHLLIDLNWINPF
ncbi:MAG: hypothetical protein Q4C95_06755 [Planctomycetia bacterium]|nr:hypothetical protein [Planctomycetia bacterium]